jgi:hypothetical protein
LPTYPDPRDIEIVGFREDGRAVLEIALPAAQATAPVGRA